MEKSRRCGESVPSALSFGVGSGEGNTPAGFRMLLVRVSCVCGRTSSFPAGERNQRLPGAGEVSMRHAGPRPPLRQAACVGGASRGRSKRFPFGSALTAPLKTFRFQRGPVLREGKAMRRRTCFARGSLSAWSAYKKASPERGGAREAGGGVPFPRAVTTTKSIGDAPTFRRN